MTTSKRSGASWLRKLGLASQQRLAKRKPGNYSIQRLQQKRQLLILGTPKNISSKREHRDTSGLPECLMHRHSSLNAATITTSNQAPWARIIDGVQTLASHLIRSIFYRAAPTTGTPNYTIFRTTGRAPHLEFFGYIGAHIHISSRIIPA
jgi:hypothetical protein